VLPLSALGQKQTSPFTQAMSALPPKADIGWLPKPIPPAYWKASNFMPQFRAARVSSSSKTLSFGRDLRFYETRLSDERSLVVLTPPYEPVAR
jgi:hypothetical protein